MTDERRFSKVPYIKDFTATAMEEAERRLGQEPHGAIWTDDMDNPYYLLVGLQNPLDHAFPDVRMLTIDLKAPNAMRHTIATIIAFHRAAIRQYEWFEALEDLGISEEYIPAWTIAAPRGIAGLLPAEARSALQIWIGDPSKAIEVAQKEYAGDLELTYYGGELSWQSDMVVTGIALGDGELTAQIHTMSNEEAQKLVGQHVSQIPGLDLDTALIPSTILIDGFKQNPINEQTIFGINPGRWAPISPQPVNIDLPEVFRAMPVGIRQRHSFLFDAEEYFPGDPIWDEAASQIMANTIFYLQDRIERLKTKTRKLSGATGNTTTKTLH